MNCPRMSGEVSTKPLIHRFFDDDARSGPPVAWLVRVTFTPSRPSRRRHYDHQHAGRTPVPSNVTFMRFSGSAPEVGGGQRGEHIGHPHQPGQHFRRACATKPGSLRLPRNGTGARYGESVSTSSRSREVARSLYQVRWILEKSGDAGEADKAPEFQCRLGQGARGTEAVQQEWERPSPIGFLHAGSISSSASLVGRQRHARQLGAPDIGAEVLRWRIARTAVVEVIEADYRCRSALGWSVMAARVSGAGSGASAA